MTVLYTLLLPTELLTTSVWAYKQETLWGWEEHRKGIARDGEGHREHWSAKRKDKRDTMKRFMSANLLKLPSDLSSQFLSALVVLLNPERFRRNGTPT